MCEGRSCSTTKSQRRHLNCLYPVAVAAATLLLLVLYYYLHLSPIDRLSFNLHSDAYVTVTPPLSDFALPPASDHAGAQAPPPRPLPLPLPPKVKVDDAWLTSDHTPPPTRAPCPPPRPSKVGRKKSSADLNKVDKIERSLGHARVAIKRAASWKNYSTPVGIKDVSFVPLGRLYRNPYAFYRSHMEMMKRFKIWTYKEGEPPLFHHGPTKSIYGVEGQFIDEMDDGMSRFAARNPDEAHMFFLPMSLLKVRQFLLGYNSRAPMHRVVLDYVHLVSQRYPFWNRSLGADHFLLSCHDWAPDVSHADPKLLKHVMRALCNANISEGFHPIRDISVPEVNIPGGSALNPPVPRTRHTRTRKTLAFFAGGQHGHVRRVLFEAWKDKDDAIQVHDRLPKGQNYFKLMGQSKFCLCPSGYEVASPRVVEAIHSRCVPVLISNNYSVPFDDVLDWTQFSIAVPVHEIKDLKKILMGVSERKYLRLLKGVISVKTHFTLNRPSKPFDMMHMLLHSVWIRRLNIKLPIL